MSGNWVWPWEVWAAPTPVFLLSWASWSLEASEG